MNTLLRFATQTIHIVPLLVLPSRRFLVTKSLNFFRVFDWVPYNQVA
jgi:hypothetical protein